jgi:acyl-coenzyme A synthetase/AMP-(fatty) acid ligase
MSVRNVRLVSLGGDRVLPEQLAAARSVFPDAVLLHRYSTTETYWIAGHALAPDEPLPDGLTPLGRPVPWLTVEIADESGTPVANDDVGEVLVTGDHLALGYLGDPERTAAKFHDGPAGRTYATGDRARRRADGVLEFVGRTDDVRKVRGVLVDLAAVERALAALPGVETAAVVSSDRAAGTGLTAFVTGPDIRPARVRADLAEALPSAMVPARILAVAELPLTPRGTIDRDTLSKQAEALSEYRPASR